MHPLKLSNIRLQTAASQATLCDPATSTNYCVESRNIEIQFRMLTTGQAGSGCEINTHPWNVNPLYNIDHMMKPGHVYQYNVSGNEGHPFHPHVNHYQLLEVRSSQVAPAVHRPT